MACRLKLSCKQYYIDIREYVGQYILKQETQETDLEFYDVMTVMAGI